MSITRRPGAHALLTLSLLAAAAVHAAPRYTGELLVDAAHRPLQADGLNDAGLVSGNVREGMEGPAMVWRRGHLRSEDVFGTGWSRAYAINAWGDVGGGFHWNGDDHAFVQRRGKDPVKLFDDAIPSFVNALNRHATAVGYAGTPETPYGQFGFAWQAGQLVWLPALEPGGYSYPLDLNDAGVIVGFAITAAGGQRAVRWDRGGVTVLANPADPRGHGDAQAMSINNLGATVGSCYDGHRYAACAWSADGEGTVIDQRGGESAADDINDAGDVVGDAMGNHGDSPVATLWHDGQQIDLNDVTDVPPGAEGAVLQHAARINAKGQILVYARGPAGHSRQVVLLTPVAGR